MNFMILFALLATASIAFALPTSSKDVWAPIITFPTANSSFIVGQKIKVTWKTDNAPVNITNKNGAIILGKGQTFTPVVLAGPFNITDGAAYVTFPRVLSGADYFITLFGDSGDDSYQFSISGPSPF